MKQHFSFLLLLMMSGAPAFSQAQPTEVDVTTETTETDENSTNRADGQVLIFNSEDGSTHTITLGNGKQQFLSLMGKGDGQPYAMAFQGMPTPFMPCGGSFLGIYGDEVTKDLVTKLNLPGEYGAHVIEVTEGSAAEKAGLQKEDVIVGYNGSRVESMAQLRRMISETPVGRSVALKVIRNGAEQEVRAELGTRPEGDFPALESMEFDQNFNFDGFEDSENWMEKMPEESREKLNEQMKELELHLQKMPDLGDVQWKSFGEGEGGPRVFTRMMINDGKKLGVTVQTLTPQLGKYFKLDEGQKGVLISEVHDGFPAANADINAGDVIVSIEGEEVGGPLDIMRIISTKEGVVQVKIIRDGRNMSVPVDLGSRDEADDQAKDFFTVPQSEGNMHLRNK